MPARLTRNIDAAVRTEKAGVALLFGLMLGLSGCASGPAEVASSSTDGGDVTHSAPTEPMSEAQLATFDQASAKADAGDYEGATTLLRGLRRERPDLPAVASRLGWVLQKQSAIVEAKQRYRDALALDPADAMAANNLALMLQDDGQFDEARQLLSRALAAHPESPALHLNLAILSELYLLDLSVALEHYRTYQDLTGASNPKVAGWIADLERRVN